jgi:N-acetylglucosaminyldiphosphoundecaprenol N-acetyl-beta-D-mannosaminyltransferase
MGCALDQVDMAGAVAVVDATIAARGYCQHAAVNAAKVVAMQNDGQLRDSVNGAGLVTADGQAVVWASSLLGNPLPGRVAGIDLMHATIALAEERGYGLYILGARQNVLERAIERLIERYPRLRIAGYRDGYFDESEDEAVAGAIRDSKPDILFVAISSPRKEYFLGRYGRELGVPFVMGVGGSIDVVAGLTKRAPAWVQRLGLEWAFRLTQEPRRLWRRYLHYNPRFVTGFARQYVQHLRGRR